jgi:SnoaL-like domain
MDSAEDTATQLEAIRRLKYAYFRTLDLKQFDELGRLLTDDATASYEDGKTVLAGREAIVTWLTSVLGDPGMVTEHHGHHPEIDFTSAREAEGTWYLEDRVIVPAADLEIGGTAFYSDRYRLTDDGWRIAHTGYVRVFEEHRTHSTLAVRTFRSRFETPPASG